jgi:serine/threonine-protein kinase
MTTTASFRDELQAALHGSYILERELADAGMARVFVAREVALDRMVVVKALSPDLAARLSLERFRREIQLTARLVHPAIAPLLTAGEAGGCLYYTLPFVEGESLRARLTRSGELPVAEAISIMRDLAEALSYAHAQGVVHRDIKPENILLSAGGALLTDFGIAKALHLAAADRDEQTSAGLAFGTPAYMAPEQAAADPQADHRADLYSLGAVAYEMLVGHPPFAHRSPQAVLAAQAIESPDPINALRPAIPPRAAVLVMQLLEKRPADRPQTASDVIRSLAAAQSQSARARRSRIRPLVPLAILLGAGLTIAAPSLWRMETRSDSSAVVAPSSPIRSVAVLPFSAVGRDSAAETLAEGLVDDLTSGISNVPGLRVASRSSAIAAGTTPSSAIQLGRTLGVDGLVEGTVERAGERFRVTFQLTDTGSGLARWAATYEYRGKDRFTAEDTIVAAVIRAIALATPARDLGILRK